MRCPNCDHSIPDELVIKMAASINGKKGVKGGKREGAGRPKKHICTDDCRSYGCKAR